MTVPLFRHEALQHQRARWLGEVVLIRPVTLRVFVLIAVSCAGAILAFLVWGQYTRHTTVSGQLVPDTGLVKVYAPAGGIVSRKAVSEGQAVQRGDLLYVLTSERQDATSSPVQANISREVLSRKASLQNELAKTRLMQREERAALEDRKAGLQFEREKILAQIQAQDSRLIIARDTMERFRGLRQQGYVTALQVQEREDAWLEQQSRRQALDRELLALDRQVQALRTERASLPARQQNQLAPLERGISNAGQEFVESESRRELAVHAPEAGVATAVVAEPGQAVDPSRPLLAVIPQGANLQAHLYAPSRAVGFVQAGHAVRLRYPAFPYQKFGHQAGEVVSVSKVALSGQEVAALSGGGTQTPHANEPLYRIVVRLSAQDIEAYGQAQRLQAGMLLEADIVQETRRLYEWVLEPLYTLSGKV